MRNSGLVPQAMLQFHDGKMFIGQQVTLSQAQPQPIKGLSDLIVLESFVHQADLKKAVKKSTVINKRALSEARGRVAELVETYPEVLRNSAWKLSKGKLSVEFLQKNELIVIDLSKVSSKTNSIFRALSVELGASSGLKEREALAICERLVKSGLLSDAVIDWGSLRRLMPVCGNFGFTRGWPVDRYYLDQYIAKISNLVTGNVLEVGVYVSDPMKKKFPHSKSFHAVDVIKTDKVDYAGDIHERSLFSEGSFDTILCFNVLEHCKMPWVVVENMHHWVKKGGQVFCMVPVTQRRHEDPKDCWRILPQSLEWMFKSFSKAEIHCRGNPLTAVSALLGIPSDELSKKELDFDHPDYPVAAFVSCEK